MTSIDYMEYYTNLVTKLTQQNITTRSLQTAQDHTQNSA